MTETETPIETPKETPPARTPRWVKIVLSLSLALNLAIAGIVGGVMLRSDRIARGPASAGFALPYVIALPREDRREIFEAARAAGRTSGIEVRESRKERYETLLQAIEADPLEADRIQAALDSQVQSTLSMQSAARSAWLAKVSTYNVEERRAYAERVREILKRGPKGKRKNK